MATKAEEDRLMWLDALTEAGVDNWEGIDEAIVIYNRWLRELEEEEQDNV